MGLSPVTVVATALTSHLLFLCVLSTSVASFDWDTLARLESRLAERCDHYCLHSTVASAIFLTSFTDLWITLYCHHWFPWLHKMGSHYLINSTTFEGTSLNIQRVSNFPTFFFKFLIPQRSDRDIIKNVYLSSCTVPLLLSDCNFRRNVIEYTTCFEFPYIFFLNFSFQKDLVEILLKMYISLHVQYRYYRQIVTKREFFGTVFFFFEKTTKYKISWKIFPVEV
jgi:hypothetical protein